MNRRQLMLGAVASMLWGTGIAQPAYPNKPIRLVVPFPPGGNVDTVSRLLAPRLASVLGVGVVVENRAGASGIIGSESVARAPADGYTVMVVGSNHGINPSTYKKLPYDSVNDFTSIGFIGAVPMVLVTSKDLPVKGFDQLIAYGRQNPSVLKFGITPGAANHLATALLIKQAGIEALMVPYKGDGPTIVDLLGGHINCYIGISSLLRQHIEAGSVTPIAVTSEQPIPLFPKLPTLIGSGLKGYVVGSWNGLIAPAGLKPEVATTLASALQEALKDEKLSSALMGLGMQVVNGNSQYLDQFLQREFERWPAVVAASNIERQ
ncbi:MAG: tripartite tricarboxylate transporter substrate binding protein [Burkholderiaceae bacterium]